MIQILLLTDIDKRHEILIFVLLFICTHVRLCSGRTLSIHFCSILYHKMVWDKHFKVLGCEHFLTPHWIALVKLWCPHLQFKLYNRQNTILWPTIKSQKFTKFFFIHISAYCSPLTYQPKNTPNYFIWPRTYIIFCWNRVIWTN